MKKKQISVLEALSTIITLSLLLGMIISQITNHSYTGLMTAFVMIVAIQTVIPKSREENLTVNPVFYKIYSLAIIVLGITYTMLFIFN